MRRARTISWIKAALKAFEDFPEYARLDMAAALGIAALGGKADIAKPLKGFDDGVFEIALNKRGDAYRVVYAVKIGNDLWVLHAFQKKSASGIKTASQDIDLVRQRLRRLKEMLA